MKLQYFNVTDAATATATEIKSQYKDLIKKYHPDINPDGLEAMKKINEEYELLMSNGLKNSNNEKTKKEWSDFKQYADILEKIIFLENINIELIGSWIWLTGQTYLHISDIKNAGFKYSANKKAWYWYSAINVKKYYKGRYNLNQLRQKHGFTIIESEAEKQKRLTTVA